MVSLQAALAAMALSGFGQTVMLDFYADWCAPCRAMNPTVESLIAAGYPVQRVNLDQNRPLAAKYGVQSIPCFIMVVDGRVVDRVEGGTTYSRLERMCKTGAAATPPPAALPSAAPPPQDNSPRDILVAPVANFPRSALPPAWASSPPPSSTPPAGALSAPFDDQVIPAVANQPVAVAGAAAAPGVSDATLLAASVRIRVADHDGHSCGSGTIIDARGGEALVLTCGHIFRDSQGKGPITVDLYAGGRPEQVAGRMVSYDLERDVGLVAVRPSGAVTTARLAPPGYRLAVAMPVASVGCNNGEAPSVRHSQVAFLDKYQGPPTVVVAGQPVEGRSGGGLFSREGYVIGVCNAADPRDKEGLFAALPSIYAELDRDELAKVYKSPSETSGAHPAVASPAVLAMASAPAMPGPMPGPMPGAADPVAWGSPPAPAAAPPTGLPPQEQAAMEDIHRKLKEGSEVVVIVRPRGNPDAKSEVFMLDHASAEFLRQLSAMAAEPRQPLKQLASESSSSDGRYHPTSLKELPKPRRVILEWSAAK